MLTHASLSAETLADVLNQSVDCVKLIALDGTLLWMNGNGLCAMEIEDFCAVRGAQWHSLWPHEMQTLIAQSLAAAARGEVARFDAFCPTALGTEKWWNVTVSPVTGVDGQSAGYLAISRDVTEAEMGRQAMVIAAAEMRHRLKNTYAMIGSLLHGFAKGNDENEAFARDMQSRLVTLSAAQSLFSTEDVPCDLQTLIPALTEPFSSEICTVSMGRFDDLSIPQGQADAVALVIGELAVNSAKHGAIGKGGDVCIEATATGGQCAIVWNERCGQPVTAHSRSDGQGLKLIERIIRARNGRIDIDWQKNGLTVTLEFALS